MPEVCAIVLLDQTGEGIVRSYAYQPDALAGLDGIAIEPVLGEKCILVKPEGFGTVSVTLEERTSFRSTPWSSRPSIVRNSMGERPRRKFFGGARLYEHLLCYRRP